MQFRPELDSSSETPIYRQLGQYFQRLIGNGELHSGDRLPATRELAGQLGLNRTTISAAYEWLESEGLIEGAVGRGSFVRGSGLPQRGAVDWNRTLTPSAFPSTGAPASNA